MGLLTTPPAPLGKGGARESEFRPVQLFKRLENFYLRWCDGEFIDALQDNYPQKKMSQLQGQGIKTGVRQVDVYAGLNVMILLLELHHYAQSRDDLKDTIAFYPCSQPDTETFDPNRLLRIIGYSHCISLIAFSIVKPFLWGAALNGINLEGVNLSEVNFDQANLSGAFLISAELSNVSFRGADLSGADFSDANLSGANLNGANLGGTYLRGAYLGHTDFGDVWLMGTNLKDIYWDEETKWEDIRDWDMAENVPEALKQQLRLE